MLRRWAKVFVRGGDWAKGRVWDRCVYKAVHIGEGAYIRRMHVTEDSAAKRTTVGSCCQRIREDMCC